jgi:rhodanese-related sulfurtransferase
MVRVLPWAREPQSVPPDPSDYALTLVRLELADGEHWYDPGIEGGLLDHLRPGLRHRPGWLSGCRAEERRVRTPSLGEGHDGRQVRVDLDWREDGSVVATVTEQLHGALAAWMRHQLTTLDDKERAALVDSLARPLLPGAQSRLVAIEGLAALGAPLTLVLELRAAALPSRTQRLDVALHPQDVWATYCALPQRRAAVLLGLALDLRVDLTVRGRVASNHLPRLLQAQVPHLQWQRQVHNGAGMLHIAWQMGAEPAVIAVDDYTAFCEAARQADEAAQLQLQR